MRLQGRRIIVTGAASGQGAAIAKLFAEEGASLALLDLNGEGVRANAESLGVLAYPCDVADQAAVERCVSAAVEALGGLDGVVNAAGLYIKKLFTELDVDSFRRMQAVNLTGPYQLIRAALPALSKSGGATIVNVASVSGYLPLEGTSGYSATKAGLIMLGKSLALELGPGIRVNTICPGVIRTEMTRYVWSNPEHLRQVQDRAALKMIGEPEDIARAALYLTTDDSRFVTGAEIVIDGGFSWK